MTEIYDKNGYGGSDFKRNAPQEHNKPDNEQDGEEANPLSEKVGEYMKELLSEKLNIDQSRLPIATRLLDQEVSKVQSVGRVPPKENRYVDIYREKPIKVSVKVLVPVKEHPKFNFVGKLLGPKGNSMKRLQEDTMCKMAVLGRGSMKDRAKEDELRNALDPKYAHLTDELHVEISALGPPAEAHARIAYALAEVRKYLIPDANDIIRQEQIRELQEPGPMGEGGRGRGRPPPPYRAPPLIARGGPLRAPPPPVLSRAEVLPSQRVMPAKTKIMSILDRARVAMEETYGYDDPYETGPVVSSRHHVHAEVDDYGASSGAHYAGAYEPAPRHHHHHAPPPVEHSVAHYYRHHHDDSPAAISTAVAESYHYPRDHSDYMGSTSSSHHHHRSYKSSASRGAETVASRRAGSAVRESRYRASPYSRPAK